MTYACETCVKIPSNLQYTMTSLDIFSAQQTSWSNICHKLVTIHVHTIQHVRSPNQIYIGQGHLPAFRLCVLTHLVTSRSLSQMVIVWRKWSSLSPRDSDEVQFVQCTLMQKVNILHNWQNKNISWWHAIYYKTFSVTLIISIRNLHAANLVKFHH